MGLAGLWLSGFELAGIGTSGRFAASAELSILNAAFLILHGFLEAS
jgi:hypothetical protein